MTTQEAIDYYDGSIKRLAEVLDLWPQAIYAWGHYPPMQRQYELQVKSRGKLQVTEPRNRRSVNAVQA